MNNSTIPSKALVPCPYCQSNVREDRLDSHVKKVHSIQFSTGTANNSTTDVSNQQTNINYKKSSLKSDNKKKYRSSHKKNRALNSNDLQESFEKDDKNIYDPHAITLDENGYVVSRQLLNDIRKSARGINLSRGIGPLAKFINTKSEGIFRKIQSVKETGNLKDKPRHHSIPQDLDVVCPICNRHYVYKELFDHISAFHDEHNPKIVLAKINRKIREKSDYIE